MISKKIVAKYGTVMGKCMKKNIHYKTLIQRRIEKLLASSRKRNQGKNAATPTLSFLIGKNIRFFRAQKKAPIRIGSRFSAAQYHLK